MRQVIFPPTAPGLWEVCSYLLKTLENSPPPNTGRCDHSKSCCNFLQFSDFLKDSNKSETMFPAPLLSDGFASTHLLDLFVAVQWLSHV